MSHRLHAFVALALEFGGFLLAAGLALVAHRSGQLPTGPLGWALWLAVLVACVSIPRSLWRRLVPAACPACGERAAYLEGQRPWIYVCRSCGHRHLTSIHDGSSTTSTEDPAEERS